MKSRVRKLSTLENEKEALLKKLKSLEITEKREREDLRLAQIQCLGEAVLKQLESGQLGQDYLSSLPLRKTQHELFASFFKAE